MPTMLIIFIISACAAVKADIVVKPRDTEAVIGDSTYFDCASNVNTNEVNWYHYAVGAKDHEDICLYCVGRIHPQYETRIQVELNANTNNSRLRIREVQRQDAGRYICQENGGIGKSTSAQLVVLESNPSCTSNLKPDGVLGPNDCGLQPDTLQLSCHVSYHGNILPVIKWRKVRTGDPIRPSFCKTDGNRMTCDLTMPIVFGVNGASYICETNRSATTQYKCASDLIRVIYAKINNSTKEVIKGDEEKIYCSVNSSISCRHKWKWFDGVNEEVVTYGSPLIVYKPGWHKCEAECNIRGKRCTMLSKLVHVSEPKSISTPVAVAVSSSVIIAVEFVFFVLVYVYLRKGPETEKNQHTSTEQEKHLLNEKTRRPRLVKQHSVTTTSAKGKGLLIRGMTILDNKLFAVTQKCSAVEVFDCKTLKSMDRWILDKLIRPADIASCKANRCLYIMDWKGDSVRKEMLCVDPDGTLVSKWETGDDYGDFISVTIEKNIIVTCLGKNEFNEYSPEGEMIRKISMQGVDVPIHAIKLNKEEFLVSSGDASHLMHRVCLVDAHGKVKQAFGDEQGQDFEHVDHPRNLAVFSDGSVAVLDNGNRRVLLLDRDLKFKQVLLSNETHELQNPTRLLLDESSGNLFVADSQSGTGAIRVFLLTEIL